MVCAPLRTLAATFSGTAWVPREVDVGVPFGGDLRTLIGEAHRAAAVEWQHVVLARLLSVYQRAIISMSFARSCSARSLVSAGSTSTL